MLVLLFREVSLVLVIFILFLTIKIKSFIFIWNMVPRGRFEPPTREFSAARALYYLMITVGFMLINLVCVKVCF